MMMETPKAKGELTEELNRKLIDAQPAGVLVYHAASGRCVRANAAAAEAAGGSIEALLGQNFRELSSWTDCGLLDVAERVLRTGRDEVFEARVTNTFGKGFVLAAHFARFSSNGELHLLLVFQDLTAQRHAEEAMRRSDRKFSRVFESVSDALLLTEVDGGRILDVNPAFTELFGYSREEALGKTTLELGIWGSLADREAFLRQFRTEDGAHHVEVRLATRDGRRFWADDSAVSLVLDDTPAMVALIRDIDERKKKEAELQQTTVLLGQAQTLAKVGAWEIDVRERRASWTAELFTILETTPEEYTHSFETSSQFYPPETLATLKPALERAMAEGVGFDLELSMITKKGRDIWVRSVCQPMRENGVVVKLVGSIQDISERKAEAEARERMKAQFYQLQKMESIGTLAGGIAHDFNNLLTGLLGGLSLMEIAAKESPAAREDIQGLIALVNRGADLTRQLLGFARRGRYNVRVVDLNDTVRETGRLFARTRKAVDLRLSLLPEGAPVAADATQLEQVVLNLLVNAGQAMPNGGGCYVSTRRVIVDAAQAREHGMTPGPFILLEVKDEGIGMSRETRERIFEPFFTTKEVGQGTGLGLASAYGIVRSHDGFICVESTSGHGSTFAVYLPASDRPKENEKPIAVAPRHGDEAVLLVDDESPVLAIASRMLSSMGYRVVTANSGKTAIEIFEEQPDFGLVILDMIMPHMTGHETFERLRAIRPDIPVLLASGYSLDSKAQELLSRRGTGFLQKPFSLESLSASLREVLSAGPRQSHL